MPLSSESIKCLEQVKKGRPARFVMVTKGVKVLSVVAYRKGTLETRMREAKESGQGDVSFGVVDGANANIVFKVAVDDGFKEVPLKSPLTLREFLNADESGLAVKPTMELVQQLPVVVMDDEVVREGKDGGVTSSQPSPGSGQQGEQVLPDPRVKQIADGLLKAKIRLEETSVSVGTNTQAKVLLLKAAQHLKASREGLDLGQYESAMGSLRSGLEEIKNARQVVEGKPESQDSVPPKTTQQTQDQPTPVPTPNVEQSLPGNAPNSPPSPTGKRLRSEKVEHAINKNLISSRDLVNRLRHVTKSDESSVLDMSFEQFEGFAQLSEVFAEVDESFDLSCGEAMQRNPEVLELALNNAFRRLVARLESFENKLVEKLQEKAEALKKFASPFINRDIEKKRQDEDNEDMSDDELSSVRVDNDGILVGSDIRELIDAEYEVDGEDNDGESEDEGEEEGGGGKGH
jgi:hypothetical protein